MHSLAYGIVNDRQTAEECENDTYMEAWNTIPPHEPRSYLYAFLARITCHISLNCCRDRSRLKRSAFICELSAEMEQCIPAPDDVELSWCKYSVSLDNENVITPISETRLEGKIRTFFGADRIGFTVFVNRDNLYYITRNTDSAVVIE